MRPNLIIAALKVIATDNPRTPDELEDALSREFSTAEIESLLGTSILSLLQRVTLSDLFALVPANDE